MRALACRPPITALYNALSHKRDMTQNQRAITFAFGCEWTPVGNSSLLAAVAVESPFSGIVYSRSATYAKTFRRRARHYCKLCLVLGYLVAAKKRPRHKRSQRHDPKLVRLRHDCAQAEPLRALIDFQDPIKIRR